MHPYHLISPHLIQQPPAAGTTMWNASLAAPSSSAWGGGGVGGGSGFVGGIPAGGGGRGDRDGLTKEELERIAKLEQERRDEEFARQLAKQEQYEASNAFYIHQAEQRRRQAGHQAASGGSMRGGGGYSEPNFMLEAGPTMGAGGMGGGMGGMHQHHHAGGGRSGMGGTQLLGGTADVDRFQQRPTLMDHLPSQLRDEPKASFDTQ
jgi:hypothetical protein